MKNKFKINRLLISIISILSIISYLFFSINGFYSSENYENLKKEQIISEEKSKIQNIYSTLENYSNFLSTKFITDLRFSKKPEKFLYYQKIVRELNVFSTKYNLIVNLYDIANKKIFNGTDTIELKDIENYEIRRSLIKEEPVEIFKSGNEIFFLKTVIYPEKFILLIRINKEKIFPKNDEYEVIMIEDTKKNYLDYDKNSFMYLKNEFRINYLNEEKQIAYNILLWFVLPFIIIFILSYYMYIILETYLKKYMKEFLNKNSDIDIENTEGKEYLDDIYEEIMKKNQFVIEKIKETEKKISERLINDYLIGIIDYNFIRNKIQEDAFYCGIIEIINSDKNLEDFLFEVKKLADFLEKKGIKSVFLEQERIFLLSTNKIDINQLKYDLNIFEDETMLSVFGFISSEIVDFSKLPFKKKEIEKNLIYRDKLIKETLIDEEIVKNLRLGLSYYYPVNTEQKIINKINTGNTLGLKSIFDDIFNENFINRKLSKESEARLKRIVINGLEKIIIHFEMRNLIENSNFKEYFLKRDLLENKEFKDKTYELCEEIIKYYKSENKIENVLESKMRFYIEENYHKEVSLQDFSDYMELTPQYLSNIYKKIFGENFNSSLNKYRILKSVDIFKNNNGNIKVKELAEKVGYSSSITYINNFKRIYGVSPTKYFENLFNKN